MVIIVSKKSTCRFVCGDFYMHTSGYSYLIIYRVADMVESMLSFKPYRPSIDKENTIQNLIQAKGKQYREDIIEACIDILNQTHFTFD